MTWTNRYLSVAELESRKDRRTLWEKANDADLGYDELQLAPNAAALAAATANVQAAIDDAADDIDNALRARVDVPILSPSGFIKRLCADMTMYFLAKRRQTEVPSDLQDLYDKALAALETYGVGGTEPPFSGRDETEPFEDGEDE